MDNIEDFWTFHCPLSIFHCPLRTILLISPYWKEPHRWMVSSVKLAELWQRLGYRVVVATMGSASGVEVVSETLTIHRKKDFFLKDPLNFGIAFGFTGMVRRIIKQEKPDLIVCNKILFWSSFSIIPLRFTGHRILLLTDALVGITWHSPRFLPRLIMRIGGWTVGWLVMRCAERLVTFHPQPDKILQRLGVLRKTQVIPTGINTALFGEGARTPLHSLRADTSQGASEEIIVTYTGRLESVKGVEDFLAAAVAVKKDHPELKIQVVGWYTENHPLVLPYERDVIFTGLRDDIPAILAKTDIFVLPSHSEGLSNSLMEAMAGACACVATDVGGNQFLIQNGVSGFLFPPGDREALGAHLRRLIDDPSKRRSLGEQAKLRIDKVFSWDVVGKQYQQLFDSFVQS
jgi:glycosyltransferase involved in cell wall biosynthesis